MVAYHTTSLSTEVETLGLKSTTSIAKNPTGKRTCLVWETLALAGRKTHRLGILARGRVCKQMHSVSGVLTLETRSGFVLRDFPWLGTGGYCSRTEAGSLSSSQSGVCLGYAVTGQGERLLWFPGELGVWLTLPKSFELEPAFVGALSHDLSGVVLGACLPPLLLSRRDSRGLS